MKTELQSKCPNPHLLTKLHPLSSSVQFSSVQSHSRVWLFATPWTAARQASLSITNSWSLLKLISIESVMPYNHLIICLPLLLLPSIFPSIRVFWNEWVLRIRWPKYCWSWNSLEMHTCKTQSYQENWLFQPKLNDRQIDTLTPLGAVTLENLQWEILSLTLWGINLRPTAVFSRT